MDSFETKIIKDLKTVKDEIHQYGEGVQLLTHLEDKVIVVDYIKVPVALRRQGIASHILDELKDIAIGHQITMKLLPSTDFGTPKHELFAFYYKNGFSFYGDHFWFNN